MVRMNIVVLNTCSNQIHMYQRWFKLEQQTLIDDVQYSNNTQHYGIAFIFALNIMYISYKYTYHTKE